MIRIAVAAFAVAGAFALAAACKDDEQGACSTGTPYDFNTRFGTLDPNAAIPSLQCVHRCGDESVAYWGAGPVTSISISALPTGSCDDDEPACAMQAVHPFCATETGQPGQPGPLGYLMQFVCSCRHGQWSCDGEYISGGAGGCAQGGGITDAAPD